jgi:hypothetical protein
MVHKGLFCIAIVSSPCLALRSALCSTKHVGNNAWGSARSRQVQKQPSPTATGISFPTGFGTNDLKAVHSRSASVSLKCSKEGEDGEANSDSDSSGSKNKKQNPASDAMRRMLEASWNTKDMGIVPSTPESAAEAAAEAIRAAQENGRTMMLIDLLLPAYDITQGELFYDEILAAKFCIQLATSLQTSTSIFVKDAKGERLISRVLENNNNNKRKQSESDVENQQQAPPSTTAEPIIEEDASVPSLKDDGSDSVLEYNDFDDFSGAASTFAADDDDSFRSQLESTWDEVKDAPTEEGGNTKKVEESKPEIVETILEEEVGQYHTMGSLLGESVIKEGSPDMFQQVVQAVDSYAMGLIEHNDAVIVLSSCSDAEMIAVRRIVATYEDKKTIILVNCKLNPLPRELIAAETVYSLLPLIARPVQPNPDDLFQKEEQTASQSQPPAAPKIVVLRRYPRDWDIFVDVDGNSGFELVESVPVTSLMGGRRKGPSMEYIAGCVKRHMQLKSSS